MTIKRGRERFGTAAGRWAGFGPYYAMFPISFARRVIQAYCPEDGYVLDPFCGRGTAPFVAQAMDRKAVGIDLNPVAWLYSSVKTNPCDDVEALCARARAVKKYMTKRDKTSVTEFQARAWSPDVLGYLNAARRTLRWRKTKVDRTLMAFILVYLHAKAGGGLSNQMRQSKAMAPDYSVRWWRSHRMRPPGLDPVAFLTTRIEWRYKHGIIDGPRATIVLGDAADAIADVAPGSKFNLLLTSPPYSGVTNYRYDNWIRLWMLGGPEEPDFSTAERYGNRSEYREMLGNVLRASKKRLARDATIYLRSDARSFTARTTREVLRELWPTHDIRIRRSRPSRATQTTLFGDWDAKPGEIDYLLTRS